MIIFQADRIRAFDKSLASDGGPDSHEISQELATSFHLVPLHPERGRGGCVTVHLKVNGGLLSVFHGREKRDDVSLCE